MKVVKQILIKWRKPNKVMILDNLGDIQRIDPSPAQNIEKIKKN